MHTSLPVPDPFFLAKLFFEKPLHTYNPILFAGVLFGRPLAFGFVMMMPFLPLLDMTALVAKSTK